LNLVGNHHSDKTKEFKSYFIEKANEVMSDLTELFKETPKVIKLLNRNNFKLGIVSTKYRFRIETILRRENILNLFEVIIGGEDVRELKPNPFGLILATKKLNLLPSDVVYIGDTTIDAETAYRAGVSFLAILSGVTLRCAFKGFQVKHFLENISAIPPLLGIE